MAGIVSLQMYDFAEIEPFVNAWWNIIKFELRLAGVDNLPDDLCRNDDIRSQWTKDDLILSQCCGYDLTVNGYNNLQPILTPVYQPEDCDGGNYCSYIVTSRNSEITNSLELANKRLAINGYNSHSGYNALREVIASALGHGNHGNELVVSGGHANSMEMVASGSADAAAIDCVTYSLIERYRPEITEKLTIIDKSRVYPVLPYVVPAKMLELDKKRIRIALVAAFSKDEYRLARQALLIRSHTILPFESYRPIASSEARLRGVMPDFNHP
jgi:ABC-type phosphate/phosphonate transport system substrate-binding protein